MQKCLNSGLPVNDYCDGDGFVLLYKREILVPDNRIVMCRLQGFNADRSALVGELVSLHGEVGEK